jgi:hypothetical protein
MYACLRPPSKSKTGIATLESECGRLNLAHVDLKGTDIAMRRGEPPLAGIGMSSFGIECASPQASWAHVLGREDKLDDSYVLIHRLSRIIVTPLF